MATLEDVAEGLRTAADKTSAVSTLLATASELASEAAALVRSAGEGSHALEADVAQTVEQFHQVSSGTPDLLGHLATAQKTIARIVSALMGDGAPPPKSTSVPAVAPPAQPAAPKPAQSWAEQQRPNLPRYVTSGIYVDQDGHSDVVQSGGEADCEHVRINGYLVEEDLVGVPPGALATVSMHVEMKVAWRMRQAARNASRS